MLRNLSDFMGKSYRRFISLLKRDREINNSLTLFWFNNF